MPPVLGKETLRSMALSAESALFLSLDKLGSWLCLPNTDPFDCARLAPRPAQDERLDG